MELGIYSEVNYIILLSYGVHIGHTFLNSLRAAAWLVFTFFRNLLIINLFKSLLLLKAGLLCINVACYLYSPIWFINLDQAISMFVKLSASWCGELVEPQIDFMDYFLIFLYFVDFLEN